ncbi:MAG: DUF4272 domain-containing protein [Brachymonas sp.]|nr:DUF4272 domain-containing protein [Brachymonas sp.]
MDNHDYSVKTRTAHEVAGRVLALIAVTARVHKNEAKQTFAKLSQINLEPFFTPSEREFFFSDTPSERDMVNFSWRAEALASLIWALKGLEVFPPLNQQTAVGGLDFVQAALDDPEFFIANSRLRPFAEIQALEADMYQQHWRVRDAQLFNPDSPLAPIL